MRLVSLLFVKQVDFEPGLEQFVGLSDAVFKTNSIQFISLFIFKFLVDRNEVAKLQLKIEKVD